MYPKRLSSMENSAETELFLGAVSLDIRILDFFSATKKVYATDYEEYKNYDIYLYATVFPNDGDEEDWLTARVRVRFSSPFSEFEAFGFKWALSLIDIEGRTRYTQYFENPQIPFGNDVDSKDIPLPQNADMYTNLNKLTKSKYLEKSFILKKADEFVSDGSLLLRCDIFCDFEKIKPFLYSEESGMEKEFFFYQIKFAPTTRLFIRGDSPKAIKVFDLTSKILTLPQFDEIRKRFGVYGEPPVSELDLFVIKEFTGNILEDIWMFDTQKERFLLSVAPNKRNLGWLLVDASPVIKQCVEAPMKEQREKRVEFPDVDYMTFLIVLNFLKFGEVYVYSDNIVKVYRFSHLYGIEKLQQKCAEFIMSGLKSESELKEIAKLAELYTDDHLFRLLQSQKRNILEPLYKFVEDDRTDFEFYK